MTYTMAPCPFCGAKMDMQKIGRDWWRVKAEVWHDDECPIDDKEFDYSQSLSAIEVESIWNKRATPPGYTLVPNTTTSAQKYRVNGEHSVTFDQDCPHCRDTGAEENCDICHGSEVYAEEIIIPWTTCKDIYYAMLKAAEEQT